jgi:6-pyruvoyltetrahydropterin/6-carboxytetrahydropterin synthase
MYSLALERDFIAQHYLIGGDWGSENELHSHHYRLELRLEGNQLDQHGYLVDIVDLERILEAQVDAYRERTLNALPAFEDLNPSIEHFCRILCLAIDAQLKAPNITALEVRLWENEIAWAGYQLAR